MEQVQIHPETEIGYVHLTVSDLEESLDFYQDILGFQVAGTQRATVFLSATGEAPYHVVLREQAGAIRQPRGTTGLYHFAIVVPSRRELARMMRRLQDQSWPIGGASDHWVSEAIYLSDPDGNGIEIYRDRPRDEWTYRNGELQIATEPLDVQDVLSALENDAQWTGIHPETQIGHIHLHVSDLERARWFYHELLGFDVVAYYGRQALFVSAGGYHHHIGLNTWAGTGAPAPPADSVGLRWFSIDVSDAGEMDRIGGRLRVAGVDMEGESEDKPAGALRARDPDGIGVVIEVSETS